MVPQVGSQNDSIVSTPEKENQHEDDHHLSISLINSMHT